MTCDNPDDNFQRTRDLATSGKFRDLRELKAALLAEDRKRTSFEIRLMLQAAQEALINNHWSLRR